MEKKIEALEELTIWQNKEVIKRNKRINQLEIQLGKLLEKGRK